MLVIKRFNLKQCQCLGCHSTIDMLSAPDVAELLGVSASIVGARPPKKDDAFLCFSCGHLMAFTGEQEAPLRDLTPEEVRELESSKHVQALREARAFALWMQAPEPADVIN